MLCRYNSKHIFATRNCPDMQSFMTRICSFEQKLKWRTLLRQTHSAQPAFRTPRAVTPPCTTYGNDLGMAELRIWLQVFPERVTAAFRSSCSTYKTIPSACHMLPVLRVARRLMKKHCWCTRPNDKEPGYTRLHASAYVALHERVLAGSAYRSCNVNAPYEQELLTGIEGFVAMSFGLWDPNRSRCP